MKTNKRLTRDVELDIDIGADAKDWAAIQANEKLKPVEAELRHVEEAISEIVTEMDYLRQREQKLRDTNESTNTRVKYFGVATTWLLVGLWAWQIMYLRAYFRYVLRGGPCMGTGEGEGRGRKGCLLTEPPGLSISSKRRAARGLGDWGGEWRLGVESLDFHGKTRGMVMLGKAGRFFVIACRITGWGAGMQDVSFPPSVLV